MLEWLVSVIPFLPLIKCKSPVQFSYNKLTNERTYYMCTYVRTRTLPTIMMLLMFMSIIMLILMLLQFLDKQINYNVICLFIRVSFSFFFFYKIENKLKVFFIDIQWVVKKLRIKRHFAQLLRRVSSRSVITVSFRLHISGFSN